jgi:hypothetical protein
MIMDNKGKLFGRISIVDILIVVIIIAGIVGAYYKFGKSSMGTTFTKTEKIQMTFYMEDTSDFVAKSVNVGDIVKDRVQGTVLGKVTDVKIGPDIVFYPDADGKAVKSSKPGYASITITVEGQGVYSNTEATFGGSDYYVNKSFELRVGIANLFPRISAIKEVKE